MVSPSHTVTDWRAACRLMWRLGPGAPAAKYEEEPLDDKDIENRKR